VRQNDDERTFRSDGLLPLSGAPEAEVEPPAGRAENRRSPAPGAPWWRQRKWWLISGAAALALILVVAVGWILASALRARSDLNQARSQVQVVQDAVLAGDTAKAQATLKKVTREANSARGATRGPAWWAGAHLPLIGPSLTTIRDLTATVDNLAAGPLTRVVDIAGSMAPNHVLRDGVVQVADLKRSSQPVALAQAETDVLVRRANASPSSGLVGPVAKARRELLTRLGSLSRQLDGASVATKIAPGMLGAQGHRTYLLAFQNNAEIKATGGIIGVYGILDADNGRVHLAHVGSDSEFVNSKTPVVSLGPEYNQVYGPFFASSYWINANVTPNFPYAARTWQALYERQSGTRIDGVIGIDPVGLADILRATGPVRLASGELVTSANIVKLVEVDAYARYNETTQREQRKDFLSAITKAVFNAVLHDKRSSRTLLEQLSAAGSTRHLQAWSAQPPEQAAFTRFGYSGEVYKGPAPYASVVLNNVVGAKLDYYVQRNVAYTLGRCAGVTRKGQITVTLTNGAPPGLPTYVTDRLDAPRGTYPAGQNHLQLSVDLTQGATYSQVRLDGKPVTPARTNELGHPRLSFQIYLTPGRPLTLTVDTVEPATAWKPVVPVQPMARNQTTKVAWTACGTGRA
jgi:hypothetical protein